MNDEDKTYERKSFRMQDAADNIRKENNMTRDVSNMDDVIDSRDVIARIEELESELQALTEAEDGARSALESLEEDATEEGRCTAMEQLDDARYELQEWRDRYGQELDVLRALADEASGSPDWTYGETLIRYSYFKDYAQEMAEDCGMVPDELQWSCTHIDWDAAADELKMDYMRVDFDGVEYFIRA